MAAVPDPRKGVFETLLVLDGRPVEWDAHMARLRASLSALYPGRAHPTLDIAGGGHGSAADHGRARRRGDLVGGDRAPAGPCRVALG